jgi:hypothetical protein
MATPYEIIDSDPQFLKVVRYFRLSDYGAWAIGTVTAPSLFTLFEYLDPVNGFRYMRPAASHLRVTTLLGAVGGFLIAYNRSTKRFWGFAENGREVTKDRYEVKRNLSLGLPALGKKPSMTPYLQDVTYRNSKNSQHGLFVLPWFSFFNHERHGIDLAKYYEVRAGEEAWGFELPKFESLEKTVV